MNKETGEIAKASEDMEINVSYAMHPMTYSEEEDVLFLPLLDGRIQCIDAGDLSLKWISKANKGSQALSPIAYKDGCVYAGIWYSEGVDGVFYALDAETGETIWEMRPSEQKEETIARDLGDFAVPAGMEEPSNFYTYTALIKLRPKAGYKFSPDRYGKALIIHLKTMLM